MTDIGQEPIKIYLDDQAEPFKVDHPPMRFSFSTIHLPDGEHTLRIEASNGLAPPTLKKIPFQVRNGVAVTVSGLEPGQTIGGQVELIINAYAGNTEVDFEPRRAETPQPIPTWAWVLFLSIAAWTMFYVFNPARPPRDASAQSVASAAHMGERVYVDTCGRCHGEDGTGLLDPFDPQISPVKRLRDTKNLAVADTPYSLLIKVVTGIPGTQMPAWGPRLTNEELVAVVNYVRTSWGHDASIIQPRFRRPPPEIEVLESELEAAMKRKDADAMGQCCWPRGTRPILYRVDGPRFAMGIDAVANEWKGYFEALGPGEITDVQLTDVRYEYDPELVHEDRAYVFAMGRIFLETATAEKEVVSEKGRFIRLYHRYGGNWTLAFDFADISMRVGCDPDAAPYCPPGEQPQVGPDPSGSAVPPAATSDLGYADVQAMFAALGQGAPNAGHENFWNLPYAEFVALAFPYSWDDPDVRVRLLVPYDSANSNIVRALRDGRDVDVTMADGTVVKRNVARMPKGGKPMAPEQVAALARWIDAGCPEFKGTPSALPRPGQAANAGKDPGPGSGNGAPRQPAPPPGAADPGTGAIGYAEVQRYFRDLAQGAPNAGHENFWELPHAEFVSLVFPYSWDDPDNVVRLLVPGNSAASNLIRALRDGKGVDVTMGDGRVVQRDIARMPKGGKAMDPARVDAIARWIDAGCPLEAGSASPALPAAPVPPPAVDPPAVPVPPQPTQPDAPVGDLGFEDVVGILKSIRQRAMHAPHGEFWRELSYAEFVAFEFASVSGGDEMLRLVVPYDGAGSNLVRALRDGKALRVRLPDGRTVERDFPRMPKGQAAIPAEDLAKIVRWVDAGCPEFAGTPSALPR